MKFISYEGPKFLVKAYFGRYAGLWLIPTMQLWWSPSTDSLGFKIVWLLWDLHFIFGLSRPWWKGKVLP